MSAIYASGVVVGLVNLVFSAWSRNVDAIWGWLYAVLWILVAWGLAK